LGGGDRLEYAAAVSYWQLSHRNPAFTLGSEEGSILHMSTIYLITGRQLETLLAKCPPEALPCGVTDCHETSQYIIDKQPLDRKAIYRVWNTANARTPLTDGIHADWSVELSGY
jgi:hypothetical protein